MGRTSKSAVEEGVRCDLVAVFDSFRFLSVCLDEKLPICKQSRVVR